MIYVATQGSEFSYKIYLQFNEYCIFWRELDLQLLFSNLVPRTFPRAWLSTTARKRIKALKRVINKSEAMEKCDNLLIAPGWFRTPGPRVWDSASYQWTSDSIFQRYFIMPGSSFGFHKQKFLARVDWSRFSTNPRLSGIKTYWLLWSLTRFRAKPATQLWNPDNHTMILCQVNCHFNRLGKYNINNNNFVQK